MLYLNLDVINKRNKQRYLTLTSVVFECASSDEASQQLHNLTLTSVVFELVWAVFAIVETDNLTLTSVVFEFNNKPKAVPTVKKFKFNKCCIWIHQFLVMRPDKKNLTLTSVVFEFERSPHLPKLVLI